MLLMSYALVSQTMYLLINNKYTSAVIALNLRNGDKLIEETLK